MKKFFWDPHLQLFPPVLAGIEGKWLLVDSKQNLSWQFDEVSALVLAALFKPMTIEQWYKSILFIMKLNTADFKTLYELFISKGFVKRVSLKKTIFEEWASMGLSATAHYHFLTWDSKFLDYSISGTGREEAIEVMKNYTRIQPDIQRYKVTSNPKNTIDLPKIKKIRQECLVNYESHEGLLKQYAALVFGIISTKKTPWLGEDILLKTSPSGGGRHPTEGYMILPDLNNYKVFHINVGAHTLDEINFETNLDWDKIFHSWGILKEKLVGMFIFSSKWERNRYRYREPRTFRSVHMDVGHMLGTLSKLCGISDLNLNIVLEDIEIFEKALGIDPFDESVQAIGAIINDT